MIPIPDVPVIDNPGYFTITSSWKEVRILQEREIHSQKLKSYLGKTNIEQAINLELTGALPKALLSNHADDEGTIIANTKTIISHME